ncbi:MAG: leucine-rich repeat domain-containing protein [Clostridia bacterium]|nr:leucine-rich repeat domain-containing protein [Clostridia bacterium]
MLVPSLALGEEIPSYQPGDTIDLVFTVTDNPNHAVGVTLKLDYDHSAFELISSNSVKNDAPIISADLEGIPVGKTVTVSFLVLPNASGGVYEIKILVEQAADIDENLVDGFAFSVCRVSVADTGDALARANAEIEELRRQLEQLIAEKDSLALALAESIAAAAQVTSENEALRRQLEEALLALEEANARAAAQANGNSVSQPAAPETDFTYEIQNGKATITKYTGKGGDVAIPDTLGGYPVGEIGKKAFYNCKNVTGATIPDSVTSIGYEAFRVCSSLTSVAIPNSVTSIGDSAFSGCSGLTSITIPDSVTSIESCAFYGCSSLTSVVISDGVLSIRRYAFNGCSSLTSIIIPDSVTYIDDYAFRGCSSLKSVSIPKSVTSIGFGAFNGCSSALKITVDINSYSLKYCKEHNLKYTLR